MLIPNGFNVKRFSQQQISESSSRLTRLLSGKFTDEQKTVAVAELENFLAEYQEIQAKKYWLEINVMQNLSRLRC